MYSDLLLKVYKARLFILKMSLREVQNKYSATSFGLLWAYVHPLLILIAMWFFIGNGLNPNGSQGNFLAWLTPGLICWNYISESISTGSSSITDYSFFLKRRDLTIESAVFIRGLATLLTHSFFILVIFGIEIYSQVPFRIEWFFLFYYYFCAYCLCLAISFITSAIYPFFKDISYAATIISQFGFWLSPILWDPSRFPKIIRTIAYLNPVAYIIEGCRFALGVSNATTTNSMGSLYFWACTCTLFVLGQLLFQKLKPHFADVING